MKNNALLFDWCPVDCFCTPFCFLTFNFLFFGGGFLSERVPMWLSCKSSWHFSLRNGLIVKNVFLIGCYFLSHRFLTCAFNWFLVKWICYCDFLTMTDIFPDMNSCHIQPTFLWETL